MNEWFKKHKILNIYVTYESVHKQKILTNLRHDYVKWGFRK